MLEREKYYQERLSVIKLSIWNLERNLPAGKVMDIEADIKVLRDNLHLIEHEVYRGI